MDKSLPVFGSKDEQFRINRMKELDRYIPHAHLFYEVGFFAKGQGVLCVNGKHFHVKAPQLHFCRPAPTWHEFHSTKTKLQDASFAIYPQYLFGSKSPNGPSTPASAMGLLDEFCNRTRPLVKLTPSAAVHVERIVNLIWEEYNLALPGFMMNISGYVQQLLVLAQREDAGISSRVWQKGPQEPARSANQAGHLKATSSNLALNRDPRIEKSLTLMQQNVKKPLSNRRLAYEAGMQEKYFIRLFTRDIGVSPQRYYLRLRLEAAAHYLINTTLPIEMVADLHGFHHRSHFNSAFAQLFKTTPSLYRYVNRGAGQL